MWGSTGLFRMFSSSVGGQISWLIPSALILLAAGLWLRGRRPRTDLRRAAYVVWGGWLVVTMLVFSFMAGIFHEYYTVALAPAIAALVGMGAVEAWQRRSSAVGSIALAAATAAAATWSFILLSRTTAYGLAAHLGPRRRPGDRPAHAGHPLDARPRPCPSSSPRRSSPASPAPRRTAVQTDGTGPHRLHRHRRPRRASRAARRRLPAVRGWRRRPQLPGQTGATGHRGTAAGRAAPQARAAPAGGMGGLLDASTPSTESSRPCRPTPARTAGSPRPSARRTRPASSSARSCRSWPSAASTAATRARRWRSSSSTSRTARSTTSPAAEGDSATRTVAAAPSSEISSWVQANFTPVTIDGSTFYDLTQPVQ